MFYNIFKGIYE